MSKTRWTITLSLMCVAMLTATFWGLKVQEGAKKWQNVGVGTLVEKGSEPTDNPKYSGDYDWVTAKIVYLYKGETRSSSKLVQWYTKVGSQYPIWFEASTGNIFVEGLEWYNSKGPKPNSLPIWIMTGGMISFVILVLAFSTQAIGTKRYL